ncbi:RidA family protein [Pacificispira sp.]|uniref:RidA family protein n=1 Tax=Pacificispira sp. TaxID=2888761 RepID=UPI003B520BDE
MAHKRIRKFNTKDTYPEQKLDNDLCQSVVARGTMVFVRGQIGQDLETSESVGIGDAGAQAHKAMQNIRMLLEESGAKMEHICRLVVYLTDIRYREAVYRAMGEYTKGVYPVSTGSSCPPLPAPNGWSRSKQPP